MSHLVDHLTAGIDTAPLRFRALGALDLRRADGRVLDELLAQPKRVALLAYLAISPPGLHRRDTLLAMFWPESDDERARGALSQALHYLRQTLGADALTARGSAEVGVNAAYLWCDVRAFDEAVTAGKLEEALELYRDDLLAGFHAETSTAFEEWLSLQRSRLASRAASAAWTLAEIELQHGRADTACQFARRALSSGFCDEPKLRDFLARLDRLGNRADALRTYGLFAERMRRDHDSGPAPETVALISAIKARERANTGEERGAPARHAVTAANEAPIPERWMPAVEPIVPRTQIVHDVATRQFGFVSLRGRRGIAIVAGLILLAATVAFLAVRGQRPVLVPGAAAAVTSEPGIEISPALSPDGRYVAYTATDLRSARVLVRPTTGGRAIAIAVDSATPYWGPKWSPDGSMVLVQAPGKALLVSPTGGSHREVLRAPLRSLQFVGWSPDGRQLVFVREDSLFIQAVDARDERFVGHAYELHSCDWSRRGQIACVAGNSPFGRMGYAFANIGPSRLVVFPSTGGPGIIVTDSVALNISPAWSPDGASLYFVSDRQGPRDIYSVRISRRGVAESEPRRLTTGANAMTIAVAGDETKLAYSVFTPMTNVWSIPWSDADVAAAPKAHTFGSQVVETMRVSRDGQWLYYDSNLRGSSDLYRVATSGGEPQQLTFDRADEFNLDVSPDGREIAFHSTRSGNRDIYVMPVEGGPVVQVTFTKTEDAAPRWSPDGSSLTFRDLTGGKTHLARRSANGTWTRRPFPGFGTLEWSPDGRRLVMMGPPTQREGAGPSGRPGLVVRPNGRPIQVVPLDSGPTQTVYRYVPGDPQPLLPVWSADGSEILFRTQESGRIAFWSIPVEGGRWKLRGRVDPSVRSFGPAWATDGKRFYFLVEDYQTDIWVMELRRER